MVLSETSDIRHEANGAATDDGTPGVTQAIEQLATPTLTTDSNATGTVPATSSDAEGKAEGVEVYGSTLPDAPTAHQRRQKRPVKPKTPAATLNLRQNQFVQALTNPDSPTYGNKYRSAEVAGYTPDHAYRMIENAGVRTAIEQQLDAVNASSRVRLGVLAQLMHKQHNVTEQYNGDGDLVSKTVTDNDKVRLQAAKELGKLDGSYARATTIAHGQRKVLDAALSAWTRKLRASLAPQTSASVGDTQAIDVDGVVVDEAPGTPDALAGHGEGIQGNVGEGTEAQDDGGRGG